MRRKIILWPHLDENLRLEHLQHVEAVTKRASEKAMTDYLRSPNALFAALNEAEENSPTGNIFLDDALAGGSKAMDKICDAAESAEQVKSDWKELDLAPWPPISGDVREVFPDLSDSILSDEEAAFVRENGRQVGSHIHMGEATCDVYDWHGVWYYLTSEEEDEMTAEEQKYRDDETKSQIKELDAEAESLCGGFGLDTEEDLEIRMPEDSPEFVIHDISHQSVRKYRYDDGVIELNNPKTLYIAASGSHRVVGENGWVTYIPSGWRAIQWLPRDPANPVAF